MIEKRTFPTESTSRGTTVTLIGWHTPKPGTSGGHTATFSVRYKDGKVAERVHMFGVRGSSTPDPRTWRPINIRSRAGISQAMKLAKGAWASGTTQEPPNSVQTRRRRGKI